MVAYQTKWSLLTWSAQSRQWARNFTSAGSSAVPSFASSSYGRLARSRERLTRSSHIPSGLCSHSNPSRRVSVPVQVHVGSLPTEIAALHMDLLQCTGRGGLSFQVRSIHAAQRDFRINGQRVINASMSEIGASHQKQLPYSLRLFSAEWLTAVAAAEPVAFVWYDFCVPSAMPRYYESIRPRCRQ